MVQYYQIFGQKVGSHVLAMVTLGSVGALSYLSVGGKKADNGSPPINASSKEEENFINEYVTKAGADKAKH